MHGRRARDYRQRFQRLRRRSFNLDVERTRNQIGAAETALYVFVGLFLLLASFLIPWDTVEGFIEGLGHGQQAVELGLRVLDRILLMLIIADLRFTLQLVIDRVEIAAPRDLPDPAQLGRGARGRGAGAGVVTQHT